MSISLLSSNLSLGQEKGEETEEKDQRVSLSQICSKRSARFEKKLEKTRRQRVTSRRGRKRRQANSCLRLWAENAELYSAVVCDLPRGRFAREFINSRWIGTRSYRSSSLSFDTRRRLLSFFFYIFVTLYFHQKKREFKKLSNSTIRSKLIKGHNRTQVK